MLIIRSHFPSIIPENEEAYVKYIEAIINTIDIYASTEITNKPEAYLIRIAPSEPIYTDLLLKEIKISHRVLGIEVEFSKSIKTGNNITFQINKK